MIKGVDGLHETIDQSHQSTNRTINQPTNRMGQTIHRLFDPPVTPKPPPFPPPQSRTSEKSTGPASCPICGSSTTGRSADACRSKSHERGGAGLRTSKRPRRSVVALCGGEVLCDAGGGRGDGGSEGAWVGAVRHILNDRGGRSIQTRQEQCRCCWIGCLLCTQQAPTHVSIQYIPQQQRRTHRR